MPSTSSRIAPGQKEETSNYRYMCVDGGVVDNSAGWAALVFAVSNRNEDINAYNMGLEGVHDSSIHNQEVYVEERLKRNILWG